MVLSAVIALSLALWIILWALGLGGFTAFLVALAIILPAIAIKIARGGADVADH